MKQEYYRQCKFKSGSAETVAWVPEKGVEVGSQVQFKDDEPGRWWEVVSVGMTKITKERARDRERRNLKFQESLK